MSLRAPDHEATFRQNPLDVLCRASAKNCRFGPSCAGFRCPQDLLHGAVALETVQVLGEIKPASGLKFGSEAWLMAVSTRRAPIKATTHPADQADS